MATQKRNDESKGSQTATNNPYKNTEYQPDPGHWDAKHVREGKERESVDFVTGRDVVS